MKVNGKPFDFDPPPPFLGKLSSYLDSMKVADGLLTAPEVAEKAKVGFTALTRFKRIPEHQKYMVTYGARNCYLFGNPKAIAQFKREIAERAK